MRFRKSDQKHVFHPICVGIPIITIVQHRTRVLDTTACVCSKTSRVDHTKSVHNRPKPAVFVRTAQGLSSNQNEVAINSKSGLWRTALLMTKYHLCSKRHPDNYTHTKKLIYCCVCTQNLHLKYGWSVFHPLLAEKAMGCTLPVVMFLNCCNLYSSNNFP